MFDAHAHLSDPQLYARAEQVVAELISNGVKGVLLGGVDDDEWQRQIILKEKYPHFVFTAFGIHPWTIQKHDDTRIQLMFEHLQTILSSATALGELGIDFSKDLTKKEKTRQIYWFDCQLALAAKLAKPIIVHVVKGHEQTLAGLRKCPGVRGIIHSFRGHEQIAKQYLDLGFILSLGKRTFHNRLAHDFMWLKAHQFVIETDAPDLHQANFATQSWISDLRMNADFLASILHLSTEEVWAHAHKNLRKIFNI